MSYNFGVTDDAFQEGGPAPLDVPYIGPAKLDDVQKRTVETKNGNKDILSFNFRIPKNELPESSQHEGGSGVVTFEHSIWPPGEKELVSQGKDKNGNDRVPIFQRKINQVAQLMGYFVGRDKAKKALSSVSGETSQELLNDLGGKVMQLVQQASSDWQDKLVDIKIVGNTWDGGASLQLPFFGFMADEHSEQDLYFTEYDMKQNRKYMSFNNTSPSEIEGEEITEEDVDF